jgi:hypothetical protein
VIRDTNGSLETGREKMGNVGRETASCKYHLTRLAQVEVFTYDRLSAVLCRMRPFGSLIFDFLDNEFQQFCSSDIKEGELRLEVRGFDYLSKFHGSVKVGGET